MRGAIAQSIDGQLDSSRAEELRLRSILQIVAAQGCRPKVRATAATAAAAWRQRVHCLSGHTK
jgi:hypothetical protein